LENQNQEPRRKWYDSLPVSKFTVVAMIWLLGTSFLLKSQFMRRFPEIAVVGWCVLTVCLLALAILMPAKARNDDDEDSSTQT